MSRIGDFNMARMSLIELDRMAKRTSLSDHEKEKLEVCYDSINSIINRYEKLKDKYSEDREAVEWLLTDRTFDEFVFEIRKLKKGE